MLGLLCTLSLSLSLSNVMPYPYLSNQGPTGRCFQLRDGSGSGIGKNFGFGYGSGSGIGTAFFINRVLSGIENLDRVFFGYIPDEVFSLGPKCTLGRMRIGFNAI